MAKKTKTPAINQQRHSEVPNQHARQHDMYLIEEIDGVKVARNTTQIPLDYYYIRKYITLEQYLAGNRFFELWSHSGFSYSQPGGYERATPDTNPNHEYHSEVYEKYSKACEAIRGYQERIICKEICCYGQWLHESRTKCGKNKKMRRFLSAIDDLVNHFGIK